MAKQKQRIGYSLENLSTGIEIFNLLCALLTMFISYKNSSLIKKIILLYIFLLNIPHFLFGLTLAFS